MSDVVYANEDNDLMYRTTILNDKKKKKDQEIDESVNNEEELEYFVD